MKNFSIIFLFLLISPFAYSQDYGPEVSVKDIQDALNSGAPTNPYSIKKGQYVSFSEIETIDTQGPIILSQRLDQVTDSVTTPEKIDLFFQVDLHEIINGSLQSSTQNYVLSIPNQKLPVKSFLALGKTNLNSIEKVTYHNLTKEFGVMPVPEVVKTHANCGGVTNCDAGLSYLKVTFDRVVWDSANHGVKTSFLFISSGDIPTYIHDWSDIHNLYFTNLIKSCTKTLFEVMNADQIQIVPVLRCTEVQDFQFAP